MRASSLILRVSFTYCSTVIKTTAASIEAPTYDEEREREFGRENIERAGGQAHQEMTPSPTEDA